MSFFVGICVGSFLNCVIYRLEKKESFLKGRSKCPFCSHPLTWKDLIPILSFLLLKGKCRYCGKRISLQYLLVEFFTGVLFFLTSFFAFSFFELIYLFLIISFLIVIFVFDLKHFLIPEKVIYSAIILSFVYQIIQGVDSLSFFEYFKNLGLALIPSLFFLIVVFVSREKWMGMGDFVLSFLMGLILGFPKILIGLFFAFFFGGIIGIGLVISGKKRWKSHVPFGPFLVGGTFLSLFLGDKIIEWYLYYFVNFFGDKFLW